MQDTQSGRWDPGNGCRAGTGEPRAGLRSRRELDSGMHGSGSGSGSQAGQGAGSSSAAGHGRRERDPRDPQL